MGKSETLNEAQKEWVDKFNEITSGMIQVAFEYVNRNTDEVDAVYVYVGIEGGFFFNTFFNINGQLVEMHKVNEVSKMQYDTAMKSMFEVLKIGAKDAQDLSSLLKEYNQDIPTQMKITYFPKTEKFNNDIIYEELVGNNDNIHDSDLFEQWFEDLNKEN